MRKIVVAVGGSSGSIYAKVLFEKLQKLQTETTIKIGVVFTKNAAFNWQLELGNENYKNYPFDFYEKNDFMAPFASGSAKYDCMIVCPCSMGLLGRIATGISNDLITRAADVVLKERRKLILVPRETPLSLIHLNNMKTVTEAGGIICPAIPSFYSAPDSFEGLAATVVDRVLDLAEFDLDSFRWGEEG